MKVLLTLLLLIPIMSFFSFELQDDPKKLMRTNGIKDISSVPVDSKLFDANTIGAWYRNNGSFNRDPSTGNAGFEWPLGSGKTARYASGIWIGCISDGDTLTAVAEFAYDYQPGFVDGAGNPKTDSTYRIYKIEEGNTTSSDYLNWPYHQGAYLDPQGKPYLLGVQTMFHVYTDAFPHASGSTSLASLKAQILQTTWAYNPFEQFFEIPSGPLDNAIFMEYRIINRSNKVWNKFWIGIWSDDDLGTATDDKIGCDTNLNLGYTYNGTNNDGDYGAAPPTVAFLIFRGSLSFTGNVTDTVKYFKPFGSNNIEYKVNYIDQKMTVFNTYNGTSPEPADPLNNTQTYRFLEGKWRTNDSWVNPITGDTTKFAYSGDPVSGTGWINPGQNDRRMSTGTGPSSVNPGDTLTIIVAQVIARGNSNLNSVSVLRRNAKILQNFYDNNNRPQTGAPSPVVSTHAPGNGKIYLSWDDNAERFSFENYLTKGIYRFQGYNIYQIRSYSNNPTENDTVLLKTFDIKDGLKNIYDSVYVSSPPGILYGVVQRGSDNGISRYIVLDKDTMSNREFINGTEYKFALTSYFYDSQGSLVSLPKVSESQKNVVKVIPQNISPGTEINYGFGDTIYTDQKDLGVMPIVFRQYELQSAAYTSIFGSNNNDTSWTLTRTVNGSTSIIFQNVRDFKGIQDTAKIADGFMLVHQRIRDSGIVRDPENFLLQYSGFGQIEYHYPNRQKGWTYEPEGREWFTAPDTNAIKLPGTKIIRDRQFDSRSLGMSFPTVGNFKNQRSRIFANGRFLHSPDTGSSRVLIGGPLRKIKIVFGDSSRSYRYVPNVAALNSTPYADMKNVPFKVFAVDELDSSGGAPRQLNTAFVDPNNDGTWNPDTSLLGGYEFTFIFASDYSESPNQLYTSKNILLPSPSIGFPSFDIMYAWLPRVKSYKGIPLKWSHGDVLTVSPYRITRPDFVPGYPVKYSWTVQGTEFGNKQLASAEVKNIKAFPNPYYGFSELEYNDAGEKFIYFSHLPSVCEILIFTLDGVLAKRINRNQTDPNNTLEKWDLRNNDGSYVASGMYIIYVDCKELGVKTLKIAVLQNKY